MSIGPGPQLLVDTSVAVALSVQGHEGRPAVVDALRGKRIGLSGHAAFETYSVLTRLPAGSRRTPSTVGRLLAANFPFTRFLSPDATEAVLRQLSERGIAGGAVYDALVAATAVEHHVPLVSRDLRAVRTYASMDVEVVLAR